MNGDRLFLDTVFIQALLNRRDQYHAIEQLQSATVKYPEVKIQSLGKTITSQQGSELARTEGEKRKATIVIWGWYRNTGEKLPLSVHFELHRLDLLASLLC